MSWTIGFIRKWTPRLGVLSVLRLRRHLIREQRGSIRPGARVRLLVKRPFQAAVTLREKGSDFATFVEVVEQEVYRPVIEHAADVRTIIDLGANVGLASLYFASHYAGASVLSVEPHPETFKLLVKNTKPNRRIRPLEGAVWSKSCELHASGLPNDRYSRFSVSESARGAIRGFSMQELIAKSTSTRVDLLKIDIEGAEVQLFRDLAWLGSVRTIAIEFHADSREASDFDSIMNARGFQVVDGGHTTIAFRSL